MDSALFSLADFFGSENLGIAMVIYLQGDSGKQPYFDRMDFVLTTQDYGRDSEIPDCRLSKDWFEAAFRSDRSHALARRAGKVFGKFAGRI